MWTVGTSLSPGQYTLIKCFFPYNLLLVPCTDGLRSWDIPRITQFCYYITPGLEWIAVCSPSVSPLPNCFFFSLCPLQLWQYLSRHMGPHYALSYTLCGHWGWCEVGVKQHHSYVAVFYTPLVNDYVKSREINCQPWYTTVQFCYKFGVPQFEETKAFHPVKNKIKSKRNKISNNCNCVKGGHLARL